MDTLGPLQSHLLVRCPYITTVSIYYMGRFCFNKTQKYVRSVGYVGMEVEPATKVQISICEEFYLIFV
jgi:hypothetical protein